MLVRAVFAARTADRRAAGIQRHLGGPLRVALQRPAWADVAGCAWQSRGADVATVTTDSHPAGCAAPAATVGPAELGMEAPSELAGPAAHGSAPDTAMGPSGKVEGPIGVGRLRPQGGGQPARTAGAAGVSVLGGRPRLPLRVQPASKRTQVDLSQIRGPCLPLSFWTMGSLSGYSLTS